MEPDVMRPQPVPDHFTGPFFDGAARGELLIQRCASCREWLAPGRPRCTECFGNDVQWVTASGRATLYSYAVVHQVLHPGLAGEVPYNVAQVDLVEGVRLPSRVVGVDPASLQIGMALVVAFEQWGPQTWLPVFTSDQFDSPGKRS